MKTSADGNLARASIHAWRIPRLGVSVILLAIGIALLLANSAGMFLNAPVATQAQAIGTGSVRLIEIDRAIDSVTERFLLRELDDAQASGSSLIVIRLNTPGGSLASTRKIVSAMLAASTPIATWVAPPGAQAASAGIFVAAAGHVFAMASGTNAGAASVVSLTGDELSETMQAKANEDAAALMRSIARERGRSVTALEQTVFDAKAYTSDEALDIGIVDLIASDINGLLSELDGESVDINGGEVQLNTGDASVEHAQLGALERLLTIISNPSLAFLFISLGGIGLIVELWNFGTWIPGILGIVFLILGFAGIGQLSFEWAGIALIGVALVMFTLEIALAPGLGIFGIGGVIALIAGGLFLFPVWDTPDLPGAPGIVNRWMLGGVGAVMLGAVLLIIREIRKDNEAIPYTSKGSTDLLIDQVAEAVTPLTPTGSVRIAGELWSAESISGNVDKGVVVRVHAVDGVTLIVRHAEVADDEFSQR